MYDTDTFKLGICLTSGKEYRFYLLELLNTGKIASNKLLVSDTERLQKKHKKGGQSAQRFCRIRQNIYNKYVSDLSDEIVSTYMKDNHTNCLIDKLIIAGPSNLKHEIVSDELIQKYFSDKIAMILTCDAINDRTIYTLLEKIDIATVMFSNKSVDIAELVERKHELLIFGDAIFLPENLTEIRNIYIHPDRLYDLTPEISEMCNIIKTKSEELRKYGGIIAEKWFAY